MRKLIVNADDLGISQEVNAQIEEGILRGVITSSTLIANAPAFEGGVRIARQYPKISIGVHLNLMEFPPLTNVEIFKKHGVVGEDGCFIEGAMSCVQIDEELKKAVYEEWDAQICKIESTGLVPTHCDSHQHTHTILALQDVFCKVVNNHKITKVRRKIVPSIRLMLRERKRPKIQLDKSKAMMPKKRNVFFRRLHLLSVIYSSRHWNRRMIKKYTMTNVFFPFNNFYYDRDVLSLGDGETVIELMCHPGHKAFQNETNNLLSSLSWLTENYELISYKDL